MDWDTYGKRTSISNNNECLITHVRVDRNRAVENDGMVMDGDFWRTGSCFCRSSAVVQAEETVALPGS